MDNTTTPTETPEERKERRAKWQAAYSRSKEYRNSILNGEAPHLDYPTIETPLSDENGYPGLPGWDTPKTADWRIIGTVTHKDGYVIVTEEAIGYSEEDTYCDEETGIEIPVSYYMSVAPGYRATRLRKVWIEDIPIADSEEESLIFGK